MSKNVRMQFQVEPDFARIILRAAHNDRRTVSDWLRITIEDVVNNSHAMTKSDESSLRAITDAARRVGKKS
jgi:predicted amino acid racemase